MTDSPELIALRKRLGVPLEGLAPEMQKQIAEAALTEVLDGIAQGVVALDDWEKRCLAEALEQLRGRRYTLARAATRRALWPEENRRASEIRKHPIRLGLTTLDDLRQALFRARQVPPAISFATARARRAG